MFPSLMRFSLAVTEPVFALTDLLAGQIQKPPESNLEFAFLCGLAGVFGIPLSFVVAWGGIQSWKRARAVVDWPSTLGRINEVVVDTFGDDGYQSVVRFQYEIDGLPYFGSFSMPLREQARDDARAESAAKYPLGRELEVFYDPVNREDFILSRHAGKPGLVSLGLLLGASLVLFCISLWGVVYGIGQSSLM